MRKATEEWDGRSAKCLCWFQPDVDRVLNSEHFIFVSLEIKAVCSKMVRMREIKEMGRKVGVSAAAAAAAVCVCIRRRIM